LGIDGALFKDAEAEKGHDHDHDHKHDHQSEVEVLSVVLKSTGATDVAALEKFLSLAPREEVYRIKGIVRCSNSNLPVETSDDLQKRQKLDTPGVQHYILNWAFGRWTCTPSTVVAESADPSVAARVTLILARYESTKWKKKLEAGGLVQAGEGETDLSVERLV
jgi:hypothetical protein